MNRQVRIFTPHNRLAKVVDGIGGRSFEDLVSVSENRLGQLEPAIRSYVGGQLTALLALYDEGEVAIFGRAHELGELAMNIAEVAGAAGLPAIGEVARGLRAMVDSLMSNGVWHTEALNLHIAALALLNSKTPPPLAESGAMLQNLHALRASIGVVE